MLGGGSSTIYELTNASFAIVGNLPTVTADAAVASVGDTAYVIGGYTGASELNTIVAFTPGAAARTVATLPVTLRYPAAAELGGDIYIAGGSTAGVPSDTVYRFDPTSNLVTSFTTLPHARAREAAAALDGSLYVIGGLEPPASAAARSIRSIPRARPCASPGSSPPRSRTPRPSRAAARSSSRAAPGCRDAGGDDLRDQADLTAAAAPH